MAGKQQLVVLQLIQHDARGGTQRCTRQAHSLGSQTERGWDRRLWAGSLVQAPSHCCGWLTPQGQGVVVFLVK
eukprot:4630263-Amphidinium_carterae.1